jgi:signal transduction histidine kinase
MTVTFQGRLLLAVLALLGTTTITLGIVGAQLGETFLRTRFEDRMAFLARYLALNSELGILLGDQKMLNRLAENLLSERDVAMVLIEDAHGDVEVQVGARPDSQTGEAVAEVRLRQQEEEQTLWGLGPDNQLLGKVHVVYSTSGINELLTRLRTRYTIAALALAAIGLLVFTFFARALAAPLKALVGAARRVAQGELDLRVTGGSMPETRELAEAFNHMLASLSESRKALEETYQEMMQQKALAEVGHFAFTVAHEVKNPLGIIKGALDILRKPEVDAETRSTMMLYVEDEVMRLNRLIQDFLDFSKPRSPRFRKVEFNSLLADVVERMKLEWDGKGVRINAEWSGQKCFGQADEDMFSQTMLNIIKNACEACDESGQVWIRTESSPDGNWIAEVADNGGGMDNEARDKALQPFFTTKAQGSGLGLAIAYRVIQAHGGEMHFRENHPRGTVFELRLPCEAEETEEQKKGHGVHTCR